MRDAMLALFVGWFIGWSMIISGALGGIEGRLSSLTQLSSIASRCTP